MVAERDDWATSVNEGGWLACYTETPHSAVDANRQTMTLSRVSKARSRSWRSTPSLSMHDMSTGLFRRITKMRNIMQSLCISCVTARKLTRPASERSSSGDETASTSALKGRNEHTRSSCAAHFRRKRPGWPCVGHRGSAEPPPSSASSCSATLASSTSSIRLYVRSHSTESCAF